MAEMNQKLVDGPRTRLLDGDFFKEVTSVSDRWFGKPVYGLVRSERARLIPYIYRTMKTSIPQLARGFGLSRDEVTEILRQNR
jgi:hypothetical protein